jgi:hypothetical protein
MKIGISLQKDENSSQKKPRSAILAVLQTIGFLGGIVLLVGGFFFALQPTSQKTPVKPEYQQLSFSKLSGFEYYTPNTFEKTDQAKAASNVIPEDILALSGTKIGISGYMLPYDVDDDGNVSEFALNGNYDMCYFGSPVSLNEWILVKIDPNLKVKYTHKAIKVYGVLEVGEELKDGDVVSLYRLNLEKLGDYAK